MNEPQGMSYVLFDLVVDKFTGHLNKLLCYLKIAWHWSFFGKVEGNWEVNEINLGLLFFGWWFLDMSSLFCSNFKTMGCLREYDSCQSIVRKSSGISTITKAIYSKFFNFKCSWSQSTFISHGTRVWLRW